MPNDKREQQDRAFTAWVLLALWSCLFLLVLWWGYYNLFVGGFAGDRLILWGLPALIALLAWYLARSIGTSRDLASWGNLLLTAALLTMSALGVFNTLMLNFEGKQIFTEAVENAVAQLAELQKAANQAAENSDVDRLSNDARSAVNALNSEILNGGNCGEGPIAFKLAQKLQQILPRFQTLSGRINCNSEGGRDLLEERTKGYVDQVEYLIKTSDWYVNSKLPLRLDLRKDVSTFVQDATSQLQKLRTRIEDGKSPMIESRHGLNDIDYGYQRLVNKFEQVTGDKSLAPELNLGDVKKLGEWGQIIVLLKARLNRLQTWVYLAVAVSMDGITALLFRRWWEVRSDSSPSPRRRRTEVPGL